MGSEIHADAGRSGATGSVVSPPKKRTSRAKQAMAEARARAKKKARKVNVHVTRSRTKSPVGTRKCSVKNYAGTYGATR